MTKNTLMKNTNNIREENVDLYINKLSDNKVQCWLKILNLQSYQGKKFQR